MYEKPSSYPTVDWDTQTKRKAIQLEIMQVSLVLCICAFGRYFAYINGNLFHSAHFTSPHGCFASLLTLCLVFFFILHFCHFPSYFDSVRVFVAISFHFAQFDSHIGPLTSTYIPLASFVTTIVCLSLCGYVVCFYGCFFFIQFKDLFYLQPNFSSFESACFVPFCGSYVSLWISLCKWFVSFK